MGINLQYIQGWGRLCRVADLELSLKGQLACATSLIQGQAGDGSPENLDIWHSMRWFPNFKC